MSDFYITLPSNSSLDHFPNNTRAQFRTKLPREIHLTGNWVVGLSDIMFPTSLALPSEHIKSIKIGFYLESPYYDEPWDPLERSFHTEVRNFQSPADLIAHINSKIPEDRKATIHFKVDRNDFVSITITPGYGVEMSARLQAMLGFREDATFNDFNNSGVVTRDINAATKCSMFQIYTIYVYTDIIQPNIVGDKLVPLLDIIPVQGGSNPMYAYRMDKPRYVALSQKSIAFPEIELMTDEGEPVPFTTGRVVVKLHFKKI